MQNKHTQHKTRPKLLTFMISMLLILSMIVPIAITEPLQVHAAGYDGTQGGAGGEYGVGKIGAAWQNSAWLLYIADGTTGEPVTGSVIVSQGRDFTASGTNFKSKLINGHTVDLGAKGRGHMILNDAPTPIVKSGDRWNPNGDKVREYLLSYSTTQPDKRKYEAILQVAFGDQGWDEIKANPSAYNIVVMTVARLHGENDNIFRVATTDGWAEWYNGQHRFIQEAMYNSLVTEYEHWGVNPPTSTSGIHPRDLATLSVTGWGMHVLDLDPSVGKQTTADEPKIPTPHDPPNESKGIKTIVKNYRSYNETTGIYTDDGKTHRDNVAPDITIEEEGIYKVIGWRTSTGTPNYNIDSTKWHQTNTPKVIQSGSTSGGVILGDTEKVLYVLLEKKESDPTPVTGTADFIISQSTITRKIRISKPDNSGITIMSSVAFKWESKGHKYSCTHTHSWEVDDGKGGKTTNSHDVSCKWGKWTDNKVNFSLNNENKNSYPDILATKASWENVTATTGLLPEHQKRWKPDTRSLVDGSIFTFGNWDYSCVLLRGKDKLTVASWKNDDLGQSSANTDLSGVSSSGFSIANNATGTRKKSLYYDSFTAKFTTDSSSDLKTTYSTTSGVSCHGGNNCGSNDQSYKLQNPLTVNAGVKVETYSGSPSEGVNDSSCNSTPTEYGVFSGLSVLSGLTSVRGIEVPSGGTISFRPYVQMNYDLPTATHEKYGSATTNHKTAYVIGDITRSMTPNDYAEVSWKERDSDKPNLTLSSLQWSTHASAADFITNKLGAGNLSKFTVLPGGATIDLTIKDSDRQRVQVTTYQCVIEGSGKTQVDNTAGSDGGLTVAQAESAHEVYVKSVRDSLDTLNVEQWIVNDLSKVNGSDITKSKNFVWNLGGEAVTNGENLEKAGHPTQDASDELKYYLQEDGVLGDAVAGEGDLDVYYGVKDDFALSTTTKKYTFFANTYGEIRYTIDDVNPNTEGNEKKGNLANDAIANAINQRTHVVDKLKAALEQGTGVDSSGRSKTGTSWYNEAFDGITVYVQSTWLSVGYYNSPSRSHVLDVKLTQTQDTHGNIKNVGGNVVNSPNGGMFDPNRYNMSQYRTRPFSATYNGDNDRVGNFKGTGVYMKDMNMLFFSRQYFIPNATVDDLH